MAIAQRQNVAAQALPDYAALMRDTQIPEASAELALTEATKTLFRAWLSYSALDSEDSAEPQVLATAVAGTSASRSAGISVRMAPGR
jgi:hypothetical protein